MFAKVKREFYLTYFASQLFFILDETSTLLAIARFLASANVLALEINIGTLCSQIRSGDLLELCKAASINQNLESFVVNRVPTGCFEDCFEEIEEILSCNYSLTNISINYFVASLRPWEPAEDWERFNEITDRNKLHKQQQRFKTVKVAPQ